MLDVQGSRPLPADEERSDVPGCTRGGREEEREVGEGRSEKDTATPAMDMAGGLP